MKERYLKPSAEVILFDVNEVNMAVSIASGEALVGEDNILNSILIGDGLIE